jgi:hypothetical protein
MKKFLLALIIIFCLVPYLNANEKKNVFMTTGLSLILPGGGFAYLENGKYNSQFATYIIVELGLLSWVAHESMINKGKEEDISIVPLTMFFAVKLAEIIEVSSKTREYNRNVKPSYSLESKIHNDKVNLNLVYKF